jgi:hypothetical protein
VSDKEKQKGQERAKRAKRLLFALSCPFCFLAVFFTANCNKRGYPDIRHASHSCQYNQPLFGYTPPRRISNQRDVISQAKP